MMAVGMSMMVRIMPVAAVIIVIFVVCAAVALPGINPSLFVDVVEHQLHVVAPAVVATETVQLLLEARHGMVLDRRRADFIVLRHRFRPLHGVHDDPTTVCIVPLQPRLMGLGLSAPPSTCFVSLRFQRLSVSLCLSLCLSLILFVSLSPLLGYRRGSVPKPLVSTPGLPVNEGNGLYRRDVLVSEGSGDSQTDMGLLVHR